MGALTNHQSRLHIGRVIRNAVLFDPKKWRGKIMNTDALMKAVVRLFSLLRERQVDYVLVGGIALLQYVEGRNTEDIDLIMALSDLDRLPEIQIESRDIHFARGKLEDLQVDILLTTNLFFEVVRRHYSKMQAFAEESIPCATVEGLLLLKLYALPSLYRQGKFSRVAIYESDLATLIHDYQPQIEPLLDRLSDHLSLTDLSSVREVISDIQDRIERFDKGK